MSKERNRITLLINGTEYTVGSDYHPATSVLKFMRSNGISVGTKVCCQEGGCGVCAVTAKLYDPITKTKKSKTVNSCCLLLNSCDGAEITTVEGLGNTRDGLHPIQERLAKYDGAQCGYCTPAQVMNMYGVLKNNPKPTMEECEDAFDSSICRCTGYRPILDAMKSFAVDAPAKLSGGLIDVEDLDKKICTKTGQPCGGNCKDHKTQQDETVSSVAITGPMGQWLQPRNLSELYGLIKQHEQGKYRLIFGNTAFGVNRRLGPWNYRVLIDLRAVQELYNADFTKEDSIHVGSNQSIQDLISLFQNVDNRDIADLPYREAFVKHLKLVASQAIRNLSSWAGNLMLKKSSPDFPSDIFALLDTVNAKLVIGDSAGKTNEYTLSQFATLDMTGKLIVAVVLPKYTNSKRAIKTFRTSKRLQQSYAYVVSGFNFEVDPSDNNKVLSRPNIVFQGISGSKTHAEKTESFLVGKQLEQQEVLTEALKILSNEVDDILKDSTLSKQSYRKSLLIGHFYKFVLSACGCQLPAHLRSGGETLSRPVMTGAQDYGTDDPSIYPVSEGRNLVTAKNLVTGELQFLNDEPPVLGQLYAAPVLASQGNARIASVDPSIALSLPGVVRFLDASNIPGENNFRAHGIYEGLKDELFCTDKVEYAGQPLGVIVAEDEQMAVTAASLVRVTYKDIQEPIVDVHDAIKKKSFFAPLGPYTKGDAQAAMASAPHRVKGHSENDHQYHFFLENQAALCKPTGTGGMEVKATTQWADMSVDSIATVLGLPNSAVTLEVERLGGAFGGKLFANFAVGAMCAVAAWNTKRQVKLYMDLHSNMRFQGKRSAYYYEYEIGFDDDGRILALIVQSYSDTGYAEFPFESNELTQAFIDSVYFCPNWWMQVQPCKTNKPVSTAMRAPATATTIFHMESIMAHVATYLKKDPLEVQKINFFQNGQTTLGDWLIKDIDILKGMVEKIETELDLPARKKEIEEFNKSNRWRKRGLHVMPNRYTMFLHWAILETLVNIHHTDGSVFIAHGGIEMGQGLNTKAIQTCAYKLGIPVEKIKVKKNTSVVGINSFWTAGSTTAELICLGVIQCCDELNKRLAPIKAREGEITWEELIKKSFNEQVDLVARARPVVNKDDNFPEKMYNTWSVCATEVELDIITGQYQIRQVDYLLDCGQSMNPNIDMGQLEGGFIMGLGLFLTEELTFDKKTGQLLSDGSWEYKPPLPKDLPIVFNCKFLRNASYPFGILGSKAIGEVPVSLASSALIALKKAIEAARKDQGKEGWFPLDAPATVERVLAACENSLDDFTL